MALVASTSRISDNATLANKFTVNITMSGGLCEAIFGGSQNNSMTGDVYITLIGGEISRRVYTGCYNEKPFIGAYKTSCGVTGTTTLSIGPDVKLATGKGLSVTNMLDMGVFCGSRYSSKLEGEYNKLVFLDNCYDDMIKKISRNSHHDEIIKQ